MQEIKFLSTEEFERLPAENVHDKLGVYYPATGEIFVRDTGVPVLDVFTAMHELEHSKGSSLGEHYDAVNGCYYKGIGEVFQNVLPAIGGFFTGGPVGAGLGAAGSFAQNKMKKKQMGQSSGGFGGDSGMSSSPMEQFQPETPNIVTPGGQSGSGASGMAGSGAINQLTGGRSPIERVRGFFSSRNPQGAF